MSVKSITYCTAIQNSPVGSAVIRQRKYRNLVQYKDADFEQNSLGNAFLIGKLTASNIDYY
jgi:hypothetical protein